MNVKPDKKKKLNVVTKGKEKILEFIIIIFLNMTLYFARIDVFLGSTQKINFEKKIIKKTKK